ncbi:hypothetical protein H6G07_20645 [Phormidium tenue FACHB-1052]|nr:hypothetical protein [Phormidium tenue FACHB-1052]
MTQGRPVVDVTSRIAQHLIDKYPVENVLRQSFSSGQGF